MLSANHLFGNSDENGSLEFFNSLVCMYLVKVLCSDSYIISGVQFIMKYCPLTSTFDACSFSSISYEQKRISLVFRTYYFPIKMSSNELSYVK